MSIAGSQTQDERGAVPPAREAVAPRRSGNPVAVFTRTFASLRHRDFALLWSGTVIMSAGQWLQQISLSWLLYKLTGSAAQLGLLNGLRFLPFLFTSLIGGVLADRVDRRKLMFFSHAYIFIATGMMTAVLAANRLEVWHLYAFTFLSGAGWSLSQPVRQSIIPSLVPRSDLLNAIALSSTAYNLTRTIGPAIGGVLLATLGGTGNFLVQTVAYGVVVLTILALRIPPLETAGASRKESPLRSLAEGLRYVRSQPMILTLLVLGVVPMMLGMPYQSLLPIFADKVFGMGAQGFGLLISIGGLGSLLATLIVAGAGDLRRKGLIQLVALLSLGITLVAFSQTGWLPLALIVLFGVGASQMTYSTLNQTRLQTSISDEMRGRVMSLYMLEVGLVPAGSFAAGIVAEQAGAPAAVAGLGTMIIAIALFALLKLKDLRAS